MSPKGKYQPVENHFLKRKIIIGFLSVMAIILILVVGLQLSLNIFFNTQLKAYLQTELVKQTKGEYKLSIDKLRVNLFTQSVNLKKVTLVPDLKINPQAAKYFVSAKKIRLADFEVFAYLFKKNLVFEGLKLVEPSGKIYKSKKPEEDQPKEKFSSFKLISKYLNCLTVKHIELKNTDIDFYDNANDTLPALQSRDNLLRVENLQINKESDKKGALFLSDFISFTMNRFEYRTQSKLYTFRVKKLEVISKGSVITADSIQFIPNYSKKDFGFNAAKQTDRMNISIGQVHFKNMNVRFFFESNAFIADKAYIDHLVLEAHRDKNVEAHPKKAQSLQQMIKDIPFYVKVDDIEVKDSKITYQEVPKGATDPGTIFFSRVNATLSGLTNDRKLIMAKSMFEMHATAMLMDKAPLTAYYGFPLQTDNMIFDCSAKLTNFSLTALNPTVEPLAYLAIQDGMIDTLIFNFHANEEVAKGKMELRYHGLDIKLLKNDDKEGGKVKDFFALPSKRLLAAILVRDSNPRRKNSEVIVTNILYEADPNKFIFNYTWKAILSGIKPAIGMPAKTHRIKEPAPK